MDSAATTSIRLVEPRPTATLHRGSTAEELALVLQNLIFRGELLPDEPMREAALSDRFEVSRRTVREALSILEHAGLVRHHRHKGTRVARLRAADIRDLYQVRRTLELAAVEAAPHAPTARRAALAEAYRALSDATAVGHADQIVAQDLEFHRGVVGLLDSPRIDEFFATIAVEMRFALTLLEASYQESKRRPKAALAEHREIHDALQAGDVSTAHRLINEHVDVNERLLLEAVGD
jgi:DNA-binding GntR family transcriptional regulator